MRNARWELSERDDIRPAVRSGLKSVTFFALLGKNGWILAFLGLLGEFCLGLVVGGVLLGEFCLGLVVGGVLLGELFRALALSGRPLSRRDDATWPHAATMPVCCPPNRPGSYRTALQPPQLADDWPFFRHADDTGALAQGERRSHRHGAGTASEHEENQHVLGADGQDRGDAGGQAYGRERGGGLEQDDVERIVRH